MNEIPACIWPVGAQLGEGPMWSAPDSTLWFVDIKGRRILSLSERTGERKSFVTPEFAAFVFRHRDGAFICGLKSGLYRFEPSACTFELIARVDAGHADNRLNDGYVDAAGRLWFGTMDDRGCEPTGSLYRYSGTKLERMDPGYVITNGPAMSPDGRILYHVDTLRQRVEAFDVDAAGALANRREFLTFREPGIYPDGPAVDCEGNLWIAMFGGWGVRCFSPHGRLLRTIDLPVAQCTKVAFGGADLKTLYITTATVGLSAVQLRQQPLAGGLFQARVDVAGLDTHVFQG